MASDARRPIYRRERNSLSARTVACCVSAPRREPTNQLPQGIELSRRFASGEGSRPAPIGTPPSRQIAPTTQSLVSDLGGVPTSLLIYRMRPDSKARLPLR